jgi:hypothetical protein
MGYLFFLSYARTDNDFEGLVRKFYKDLCKNIAGKIAVSPDEVGFYAGAEIRLWIPYQAIESKRVLALQQSRVFIATYSSLYFQEEFCGKEWAVFSARVEAYAKSLPQGSEFPALMFPVLWESEIFTSRHIPHALSKIQYKNYDYGKDYVEHGLPILMRSEKFRQQYDDFISVLADKVIGAAQKYKLPALQNPPPLDYVTPAFPIAPLNKESSDTHTSISAQKPISDNKTDAPSPAESKRQPYQQLPSQGSPPVRPPATIFISYRRQDSGDITGRIYDRLVQRFGRETIFKDVDSIPPGVDFRIFMGDAVGQCNLLLAVIGRQWLSSQNESGARRLEDPRDFVRIEIESALQRDIPVIPLLVQGAAVPGENALPPSLQKLAYRNAIPIRPDPDFHSDVDRLIKSIELHFKNNYKKEFS